MFNLKSILAILLVVAVQFAVAKNVFLASGSAPANVRTVVIADNTLDSIQDTIAIGAVNTYGPFSLAKDLSYGMATGFAVQGNAGCLASGDSAAVQYGLSGGTSISDTPATFVAVDTLTSAGKFGTFVSLASKAATQVWIRIVNIDATAIGLAKTVRVIIRDSDVQQ